MTPSVYTGHKFLEFFGKYNSKLDIKGNLMKKLAVFGALVTLSTSAYSAPITPMDGYYETEHSRSELNTFWRTVKNMAGKMKGKDCFKRAHMWSFKLERSYGVKSKKIFMHYTDKFNHELDDQGRSGVGRFFGGLFSGNEGWDFHVATVVNINGEDVVLDGKLRNQPDSVEEWINFLAERGVSLLKKRQRKLVKDLNNYRKRLRRNRNLTAEQTRDYRAKIREIEEKMAYLGLTEDLNQKLEIKCKQIDNISEFDSEQQTEWCHYQMASMYYFGPLQLRYLNYGELNWDQRLPVTDLSLHTEANFRAGRNYVYRSWDIDQLEGSLDELKQEHRVDSIYEL